MAAIQKNFVVKKGLEVNSNLLVANSDTNKVGIATTTPTYLLHVNGGIGVTFSTVTGITTTNDLNVINDIFINGIAGSIGQYIGYTTTGLNWATPADIGGIRNKTSFTANSGQNSFSLVYEIGLLDVYVNGVKLADSEFVANDGVEVTFNTACFGGEYVEFIAYANTAMGIGVSGIPGINIKNNGVLVSNPLSVVNLDFVGATITTTGVGATINVQGNRAGWNTNTTGIHTLSNVGIGTTNAVNTLTVDGTTRIKGFVESVSVATTTNTTLFLDGNNGTVFSHTTAGPIGIVSFSGITTARAGAQTFSVLVRQGNTPVNVTPTTGIGTQLATVVIDNGVGYSTHIKVGSGTTILLTNSANALDLLTFIVSYDGNTSIANTSFTIIGFAASDFRGVI